MPEITVRITKDYLVELEKRLKEYGISQNGLAKEMGLPATDINRMFRKHVMPRMDKVVEIEQAIVKLRKAGARKV